MLSFSTVLAWTGAALLAGAIVRWLQYERAPRLHPNLPRARPSRKRSTAGTLLLTAAGVSAVAAMIAIWRFLMAG